jgi:hypothetical protein
LSLTEILLKIFFVDAIQVFEDDWSGRPVAGHSYLYEMDDYRNTLVLVEVIQLDLINLSVLIRLPNGGERDSEYAKLLSHLVSHTNNTSDRNDGSGSDPSPNNGDSPIASINSPTTSGMDESSVIIECYIQDLYTSTVSHLEGVLSELGIPFQGETEQSKED